MASLPAMAPMIMIGQLQISAALVLCKHAAAELRLLEQVLLSSFWYQVNPGSSGERGQHLRGILSAIITAVAGPGPQQSPRVN